MNVKKIATAGILAALVMVGLKWFNGGGQAKTVIHFELGEAKGPLRADLWLNEESVAFYEHQGETMPRAWTVKTKSGDYVLSLSYRDRVGEPLQNRRVISLVDGATLRVPVAARGATR